MLACLLHLKLLEFAACEQKAMWTKKNHQKNSY